MGINKINVNSADTNYAHSIFDISEYNSGAKYDDLSQALAAIPQNLQKGGMSIRYVLNSDNKYVQYRLMSDQFSNKDTDWCCETKGFTETETGVAASIVELYLYGDGIDRTHTYFFDRIDRKTTQWSFYRFFIKDATTDTLIIAYTIQNIEPTGIIQLTPENDSEIYGKVIINWNVVPEGVYNLNLNIPLTHKVFDIEYCPTIQFVELKNEVCNAIRIANGTDYIQISEVWIDNQYFNTMDGRILDSEYYARTELIETHENYDYKISGYIPGSVICFNSNKAYLGEAPYILTLTFTTLPTTAYIGVNFNKSVQPSGYKENGIIIKVGTPITKIIESVIGDSSEVNILSGKKWCVVGDSFSQYSDEQFESGRFVGQNVTYKYLIAERNNMTIVDMAVGGRTMAYPNDHTFDNAFAKPSIYLSIPSDVDYITIMLGINDGSHYAGYSPDGESTQGYITLGTIDSTDTGSFYGAWNVVLDWIFTNRPYAHVGILITNGMGDQYGEADVKGHQLYQAILDICQKWNVPHINLNGGDGKTPMMQRGIYPEGTPASLIASKWNSFAVDPVNLNGHTNAKGHRYESTFIENFLRSI